MLTEDRFAKEISVLLEFAPIPCIVADESGRAVGAAILYRYSRPARSYHLALTLFEQPSLTQAALKEVLDEIFRIGWARMVVCEVPAYYEAWLNACRALGMEEAGCIPDSYCCDGKLYPMYTMIARHGGVQDA